MISRTGNVLAAISFVVFISTAALWLKEATRATFNFGPPIGLIGTHSAVTPSFPRFKLIAGDGFNLTTLEARPAARGPKYLSPEYLRWEQPMRSHERLWRFLGFGLSRSAVITHPVYENQKPLDATEFQGYETQLVVPYWFVLAVSAVVPVYWVRMKTVARRRQQIGRCPVCGYDIRATPDRCPECGAAITVKDKSARGPRNDPSHRHERYEETFAALQDALKGRIQH